MILEMTEECAGKPIRSSWGAVYLGQSGVSAGLCARCKCPSEAGDRKKGLLIHSHG